MEPSHEKLTLRNIFNEIDPMGIFFETNVDEYDYEIDELMAALSNFSDANVVENKLREIFNKAFSPIKTSDNVLISRLASAITAQITGK